MANLSTMHPDKSDLPFKQDLAPRMTPSKDLPFYIGHLNVNWSFSHAHIHVGIEIGTITRGEGYFYAGGVMHDMRKGDCYMVNGWTPHAHARKGGASFRNCFCQIGLEAFVGCLQSITVSSLFRTLCATHMESPSVFRHPHPAHALITQALKAYDAGSPLQILAAWGLLLQALAAIGSTKNAQGRADEVQLRPPASLRDEKTAIAAVNFIQQNATHRLSINQIAEACNVSQSELSHIFKKVMNISPIHFHNRLRINSALQRIIETDEKIDTIASMLGYASFANFNAMFRKFAGQAPAALRRDDRRRRTAGLNGPVS